VRWGASEDQLRHLFKGPELRERFNERNAAGVAAILFHLLEPAEGEPHLTQCLFPA